MATRYVDCESTNHKPHKIPCKVAWRCPGCSKILCSQEGCGDDMPDHCDDCWAQAHKEAA